MFPAAATRELSFDDLRHVVLPLFAVGRGPVWHEVGTAFVVGVLDAKHALLMTAAHNLLFVRDGIDSRGLAYHPTTPPEFRPPVETGRPLKDTRIHVLVPSHSGGFALGTMMTSWFREHNDVAMLLVELEEENAAAFEVRLVLDTRPIEKGQKILAMGYPRMVAKTWEDEHGLRARLDFRLRVHGGVVVETLQDGSGIHRNPGFLVSCPFDSGMSGGPIVDASAYPTTVRGIVGSDLSESPGDMSSGSGAYAFASMLWAAMMIPTDVGVLAADGSVLVPGKALFLDLSRHGVIDDRGEAHEHLHVEESDGVTRWWWI